MTPWTVACQAPLSMGFLRQECWSGLPLPSLGDLLNPGIKPRRPALQADSLLLSYHSVPISSVSSESCLSDHLLFIRVHGFGVDTVSEEL